VAGKGPSAALLTAMIQGIFAAQIGTANSAAALISSVNEGLIRRSLQSRFATCVYGTLARDGRLTYCNAGHNPPLLIGRDGIRRLEAGGLILGVFPQAIYDQETLTLEPGDLRVMFSDGVTEAVNAASEQFGEEPAACVSRREPTVFARGGTRASHVHGAQLCIGHGPVRRYDSVCAALQGHIADFSA
jgi:sigma-B regulation protein RsbU (phosphoserine phosphatase)